MLKQRLWTACVLIPLVLAAILYLPPIGLGIVVLVFLILAAWEWSQLVPLHTVFPQVLFILMPVFLAVICTYALEAWLWVGLGIWLLIILAIVTFPKSQRLWGHRWIVLLSAFVLLPLIAASLEALYEQAMGRALIIYLLCLVWATDTGAYAIGKRFGKNKLMPAVSPGKTIEGTIGGVFFALFISPIAFMIMTPEVTLLFWVALAFATSVMTVFGDLFMSMLKRRCNVKDTGHLFPGHGGLLDRMDGFIAALPVFALGVFYSV